MPPVDSAYAADAGPAPLPDAEHERLRRMAVEHFQFIWRSLRRLGVPPVGVDDAVQKVFEVATVKLALIEPGRERAFLFHTAVRVAKGMRRHFATRRETSDDAALENRVDPGLLPDEAADWKRRRELLDEVLGALPFDLRSVFVLFELEGLSTLEIAELLEIPAGTAASRLRRAREHFHDHARRLRARRSFSGDER